jgi:hypothetical protein
MQSQSFVVVRHTSPQSLARQGDILNAGKPCELSSYHTAGDNSIFHGYIVVKKDQMGAHAFIDPKTKELHLRAHPQYKLSKPCPKTGDRMIMKDGEAYFSDYDFMGIYAKDGSAFGAAKLLNDHPWVVDWTNRLFPGLSRQMVRHGMQDFFIKRAISQNGQIVETMGRQPKLDEMFLVFQPNGKVSNMNLSQLHDFYVKHNMHWPYEAFQH